MGRRYAAAPTSRCLGCRATVSDFERLCCDCIQLRVEAKRLGQCPCETPRPGIDGGQPRCLRCLGTLRDPELARRTYREHFGHDPGFHPWPTGAAAKMTTPPRIIDPVPGSRCNAACGPCGRCGGE